MTMRLTPNKIVFGGMFVVAIVTAQNRYQTRHMREQLNDGTYLGRHYKQTKDARHGTTNANNSSGSGEASKGQ